MPDEQQQKEAPDPEPADLPDMEAVAKEVKKRREAKEKAESKGASPEDYSDEELQELANEKAKIAQILTRGVVNDRLDVKKYLGSHLDPNRRYEWIRETDQDIARAKSLGYRIESVPEDKRKETSPYHGAGDGRIRLGDVILMSTSLENYQLIQSVKEDKKQSRADAGKRDYVGTAKQRNPDVPVINPHNVQA